jgi:hypothetical protein
MINSGLGTFLAILILLLLAVFGYYNGFMGLLKFARQRGSSALAVLWPGLLTAFVQLAGAAAASGIAILFYFSQAR